MLQEWLGISHERRESLDRVVIFLAKYGLGNQEYAYVQDMTPPPNAKYIARYGLDDKDGLNTTFSVSSLSPNPLVTVSGITALTILCVLAFSKVFSTETDNLIASASLTKAFTHFELDANTFIKPDVKRYLPGVWAASSNNEIIVFEVDTNGELIVIGRGSPAGAVFLIKAILLDRASGIRRLADAR